MSYLPISISPGNFYFVPSHHLSLAERIKRESEQGIPEELMYV
jgi:hypothetical protein